MGKKSKRVRSKGSGGGGGGGASQHRREARRRACRSPRAEADHLREEFLRLPSSVNPNDPNWRHELKKRDVLGRYEDIIRHGAEKNNKHDDDDFVTKEDYDFMKRLYKDEDEFPQARAKAVNLYAYICFHSDAYVCYNSSCDRKEECLLAALVCVTLCNEAIQKGIQSGYMQEMSDFYTETLLKEKDGRDGPCRHWKFPNSPSGEEQQIAKGGVLQCSGCGRRVKIGLEFFRCCGRCKKSYYCSKECQASDWKEGGHRSECRKKGEFKVGDTVYLASDPEVEENRWIPCDCKVQLLHPIITSTGEGKKPQKWLVSDLPRHKHVVVSTLQLHRVRSLKWWNFIDHENKRRVVQAIITASSRPDPHTQVHLYYPTNPQRDNWLDVYVDWPCMEDVLERHKRDEEGRLMTDRDGGKWRYVINQDERLDICNREYHEGGFDSIDAFKKHMKGKYYISDGFLDNLTRLEDPEELQSCEEGTKHSIEQRIG